MHRHKRLTTRAGLALALLTAVGSYPVAAAAGDETRVTRSSHYVMDGRNQSVPDKVSLDEVAAGDDAAAKPGRRSSGLKGSGIRSATPNLEFWFYAVDVELFADEDLDGYFHGIDVLFDADTVYEQADVYAVLYLSRDGGPWYEYATTDVFSLYGATSDDDFVIVSELLSGYPRGSYDILIELYDTWDGSFVADIGPESSAELGYLPLEDANRDEPPEVVVVEHGGGAVDPAGILLLGLMSLALTLRRRRSGIRLQRLSLPSRAPSA